MKKTAFHRLMEIDHRAKKTLASRRRLMSAAEKKAEEMKLAADQNFIHWALMTQQPIPTERVQRFIEDKTGLSVRAPGPIDPSAPKKERGPRFQPGDRVYINVNKHVSKQHDITNYEKWDKSRGIVVAVAGMDAYVKFNNEDEPVLFPGALSSRGVGIYKGTSAKDTLEEKKVKKLLLEFVYVRGGIPTAEARQVALDYLNNNPNRNEADLQYYSGIVVSVNKGPRGFYYTMITQQRRTYVGDNEKRSFNPSTGTVFYMGMLGHRPRTWKQEWARIKAETPQ